MQPLKLNEFLKLSNKSKRVAVFDEIFFPHLTPDKMYGVINSLYKDNHGVLFEDLLERGNERFSYMCFEPFASIVICNDDNIDPLQAIRQLQFDNSHNTREDVADQITSSLGFISYDAIRYFEDIPDSHPHENELPVVLFNMYSLSLTFNHEKKTTIISYVVEIEQNPEKAYQIGKSKINDIIDRLKSIKEEEIIQNNKTNNHLVESNVSDDDFMQMVDKAKKHIIAGDAFQIVISRCFQCKYSVTPFEIYKMLRQVSPAPFMFYVPYKDTVIIGASPERLISVKNNIITSNPIAGTRKRSSHKKDESIELDLLSDVKEIAEHMMLVDLARNDVGAVAFPGSVEVAELLKVKHYSHISHITSTVTGELSDQYDALDAFAASFPAGTLTGAPKIRAMEIIDELETSRRGLYGGAICRFDSAGNFDSCIAIRMAHLKNGVATIRAGAGVVYDSNPAAEANETRQKAFSILDAIAKAHGE